MKDSKKNFHKLSKKYGRSKEKLGNARVHSVLSLTSQPQLRNKSQWRANSKRKPCRSKRRKGKKWVEAIRRNFSTEDPTVANREYRLAIDIFPFKSTVRNRFERCYLRVPS